MRIKMEKYLLYRNDKTVFKLIYFKYRIPQKLICEHNKAD